MVRMRAVVFLVLVGVALANIAFDEWSKEHGKIYNSWRERQYRQVRYLELITELYLVTWPTLQPITELCLIT